MSREFQRQPEGQTVSVPRRFSLQSLLTRPVLLNGIELGRPLDAMLDLESRRAVGLEIVCGDQTHRFLPLGAALIGCDTISVGSALVLLDADAADFYRRRGSTFAALQGVPVQRRGRALGELRDLVVDEDGAVAAAEVGTDGARTRVRVDDSVTLGG